jgi:chemotaxis protein MotB
MTGPSVRTGAAAGLLLLLGACVSESQYRDCQAANAALRRQLEDLKRFQGEIEQENVRLSDAVLQLGKRAADVDELEAQKAKLKQLLDEFTNGGGGVPTGVRLVQTAEGIAFEVQGEVLFASGSNEITSSGKSTLDKLLPTLVRSGKRLRVDGHTDTDPIRNSAWKNNLELSLARAFSVSNYLLAQGLDEKSVSAAGYGPWRPAATGDSAEIKRQNRRVEILMLEK